MQKYGIEIDLKRDENLTDFSRELLKEHYLAKEETSPQEAFARASVAYSDGDLDFAQRIYDYASKKWFMFASPVLSNAPMPGEKPKALPISCYLSEATDDLDGLINHSSEVKWLSVKGGGIGGHWSSVRSVSKKAPGPIPFIKTVDSDIIAYKQGSVRRGSYAAYLDVSHPDVEEFLQIRVPTGGDPNRKCFNIHNAVNITNEFMEAVGKNLDWNLIDPHDKTVRSTIKARDLWQRIIETRFKTGEPYLHFIDTSNAALPKSLTNKGLHVKGSNLCVTGDQRVPTQFGLLTAKELYELGKELIVFDGEKAQNATAMKLIEQDQTVYKITLENGMTHTVTDYHKVMTELGPISCFDLSIGMNVKIQNKEGLFNIYHDSNKNILDSANLIWIREHFNSNKDENFEIPDWIWNGTKNMQAWYVHNLVSCIENKTTLKVPQQNDFNNEDFVYYKIISKNTKFLSDVQILLSNLGWQSEISDEQLNVFWNKKSNFSKIKSIVKLDKKEDVYCVGVHSEEHLWVCNGIVTHNCSEILLPTSKERTAVCCLSSLNLELYDEWKDTSIVRDLIRLLDNVLTAFIMNAPDEISKAKFSATMERSLGLGTMGFHSYLQSKMIPWESLYAKIENINMFTKIQEEAIKETVQIAKIKGCYPDAVCDITLVLENGESFITKSDPNYEIGNKYATSIIKEIIAPHYDWQRRNAHLLAIAPNANNSIILGTSASIEPIVSNAYTHRTRLGTKQVKNKHLEVVIEKYAPQEDREIWLNKIWTSITTSNGSVQHLDFLSDDEKNVFKTSYEIDQNWVIEHAADRQPFICQGQSVNLFFPYNSEKSYVNEVHLKAWKLGLKTLYYLRSEAGIKADKVSSKIERRALADFVSNEESTCLGCEG